MPAAEANHASKKRKPSTSIANPAASKKARHPPSDGLPPGPPHDSPLCAPHAPILHELGAKYDVLPASVISSTPIRKRLVHITTHLLGGAVGGGDGRKKPRVVLLHARATEVCKMITVAEKCKRLLEEQGEATWYQYNQLFDVSRADAERATRKREKRNKKKQVVEETVLHVKEGEKEEEDEGEEEEEEEDDGDESDAFETMQARFEKAVLPPAPDRTTKSLRIFLSTVAIPELKAKDGVTVQTSGK
ncbi:hypothetical protein BBAD15_g11080 [Beauveria bassiana D1-5]|uniref:DNA/RNA-binding protein Alba-like domain-containing protein n=1 Tax=Beauveria bassiana D1-5 TaxID=1245745 RepID=A0A0A2VBL1_BEABA|nr:hypothetical protein BBAD15_g11080 [Beauveria bassiana D1-5]